MDFDAHDGETERARRLAFAAFEALLNTSSIFLILESTGSGGWHLWAVAQVFYPVTSWVQLLKAVASHIGAPLTAGICEIFPPDSVPSEFGLGVRAPGCWNPSVDAAGEIYWENTKPLLASLSGKYDWKYTERFPDKRKKIVSLAGVQESQSQGDTHRLYLLWTESWSSLYAITQKATRNDLLCKLTGEMFFQVGFDMGYRIATVQFQQGTVPTSAGLKEHLNDFTFCWRGLAKRWEKQLLSKEISLFGLLSTDTERDAFRIIWSYAHKATLDSNEDFPVARDNLAERLGISGPGAGGIRRKFTTLGILRLTQNYQPNKRAARYAWLLRSVAEFRTAEPTASEAGVDDVADHRLLNREFGQVPIWN